ncbi:M48 family metalloprotease [Myxococcota bacterium]|nr:M48 family metalloprotease [Myxococcota bacterium]
MDTRTTHLIRLGSKWSGAIARRQHGLFALGFMLALACQHADSSRTSIETPAAIEQERVLGMEFDRKIQGAVPIIDDPLINDFVNELGKSIVQQIEPQPFIYRFRVIENPTLNAFAVPGGYIYLHSRTLLEAESIDEIAGVMGHEIAHVDAHHHLRMQEKMAIPSLLTSLAAIGIAFATNEPGVAVATQGVNQAMGLKNSRLFEAESDELGAIWLTRAGYQPDGIVVFFERIMGDRQTDAESIPPYLFTHPDVEERIEKVRILTQDLEPVGVPDPELARTLPAVQERLILLRDTDRLRLPIGASLPNHDDPQRAEVDQLLEQTRELSNRGALDAALLKLAHAEGDFGGDARIPVTTGELLYEAGRFQESADAYARAVALGSSQASVFYHLGRSRARAEQNQEAVYALETAARRAKEGSRLQDKIFWEIDRLTFTRVSESGFSNGISELVEPFSSDLPKIVWWARLGQRFANLASELTVRWIDPDGRVVTDGRARSEPGKILTSTLTSAGGQSHPPGTWTVEASLKGDVIERTTFEIEASTE